jgi:hypothetical protein
MFGSIWIRAFIGKSYHPDAGWQVVVIPDQSVFAIESGAVPFAPQSRMPETLFPNLSAPRSVATGSADTEPTEPAA